MNIQNVSSNYISCSVKECAYHGSNDCCTAPNVEINDMHGPVSTSDNTCCKTFVPIVKNY